MRITVKKEAMDITAYFYPDVICMMYDIACAPRDATIWGQFGDRPLMGSPMQIVEALQQIAYQQAMEEGFSGILEDVEEEGLK